MPPRSENLKTLRLLLSGQAPSVAAMPQPGAISVSRLRESGPIDSLCWGDSRAREEHRQELWMLDGKRYFAEFPDEDPKRQPKLLKSPELMASLRALEKELRPYLQQAPAGGLDGK
jgi:hypothetical protein